GSPTDTPPLYAQIGNGALNGSVSGAVTGNINVQIGGTLGLLTGFSVDQTSPTAGVTPQGAGDGRTISIGNESTGAVSGNTTIVAFDVDDSSDENGGFSRILANDIAYGDVTFGRLTTATPFEILGGGSVTSAHNLTLLSAGDLTFAGTLQNNGTGA